MEVHPTKLLEEYVLQTLPVVQAHQVRRHLSACPQCQRHADEIERTLALLAYAAPPLRLPVGVEARFFARIGELRHGEIAGQSPGLVALAPPPLPTSDALPHFASDLVRGEADSVATASPTARAARRFFGRRARWRPALPPTSGRLTGALAALVAVLLITVSILGFQLRAAHAQATAAARTAAQQRHLLELMASPHALVRPLAATTPRYDSGGGTLVLDMQTGQGGAFFAHLPPAGAARTYELWLVEQAASGERVVPVATFATDRRGNATVSFTTSLFTATVRDAGISVERAGGVQQPDSPMLLLASAASQAPPR